MECDECCMCGDVGLNELLFLCTSCNQRFQHMYCSQGYPCNLPKQICNWCILSRARDSDRDTATPSFTTSLIVNVGDGIGMRQKRTKLGSNMDHPISPSFHNNNKKKKEKEKQREEREGGRNKQEFGVMIEEGSNSLEIMRKTMECCSRERESSMVRAKKKSYTKEEEKKKNDESKNNKAVRRYKYLLDVY